MIIYFKLIDKGWELEGPQLGMLENSKAGPASQDISPMLLKLVLAQKSKLADESSQAISFLEKSVETCPCDRFAQLQIFGTEGYPPRNPGFIPWLISSGALFHRFNADMWPRFLTEVCNQARCGSCTDEDAIATKLSSQQMGDVAEFDFHLSQNLWKSTENSWDLSRIALLGELPIFLKVQRGSG